MTISFPTYNSFILLKISKTPKLYMCKQKPVKKPHALDSDFICEFYPYYVYIHFKINSFSAISSVYMLDIIIHSMPSFSRSKAYSFRFYAILCKDSLAQNDICVSIFAKNFE